MAPFAQPFSHIYTVPDSHINFLLWLLWAHFVQLHLLFHVILFAANSEFTTFYHIVEYIFGNENEWCAKLCSCLIAIIMCVFRVNVCEWIFECVYVFLFYFSTPLTEIRTSVRNVWTDEELNAFGWPHQGKTERDRWMNRWKLLEKNTQIRISDLFHFHCGFSLWLLMVSACRHPQP